MTGIDWDAVRAELDASEWEYDRWDRTWSRQTYLGKIYNLFPSGKVYAPWACSNLEPCPRCAGRGHRLRRGQTRRRLKKWRRDMDRIRRLFVKRGYVGHPGRIDSTAIGRRFRRLQRLADLAECDFCGGVGSREAYLDDLYREALEAEAEERGLYLSSGEGDPTDLYAGERSDDPPDGWDVCPVCDGSGRDEATWRRCPECSGAGEVRVSEEDEEEDSDAEVPG